MDFQLWLVDAFMLLFVGLAWMEIFGGGDR